MSDFGEERRPEARRALFDHYRARGGRVWIEAVGGSMHPSIREGDWLLVDFSARQARVGEIVIFPVGEQIVVHRVVRRPRIAGTPRLLTKGDARLDFDEPIRLDEILGVVRAVRDAGSDTARSSTCSGTRALVAAGRSSALAYGAVAARHLPERFRGALLLARRRLAARRN